MGGRRLLKPTKICDSINMDIIARKGQRNSFQNSEDYSLSRNHELSKVETTLNGYLIPESARQAL